MAQRGAEDLPAIKQAILELVSNWRAGGPAEDDTTLMLLRRVA